MKLTLKSLTIVYLLDVIKQLQSLVESSEPLSDENLVEVICFVTEHLNISPRELALKFGVTPSTISRWKNGKNMPITLARGPILVEIQKIIQKQIDSLQSK